MKKVYSSKVRNDPDVSKASIKQTEESRDQSRDLSRTFKRITSEKNFRQASGKRYEPAVSKLTNPANSIKRTGNKVSLNATNHVYSVNELLKAKKDPLNKSGSIRNLNSSKGMASSKSLLNSTVSSIKEAATIANTNNTLSTRASSKTPLNTIKTDSASRLYRPTVASASKKTSTKETLSSTTVKVDDDFKNSLRKRDSSRESNRDKEEDKTVSKRLNYLENIVKDIHRFLKKDNDRNSTQRSNPNSNRSSRPDSGRDSRDRKVSFREGQNESHGRYLEKSMSKSNNKEYVRENSQREREREREVRQTESHRDLDRDDSHSRSEREVKQVKQSENSKIVETNNSKLLNDSEKSLDAKYAYMKSEYENYIQELNKLNKSKTEECVQYKTTIKNMFQDNSNLQVENLELKDKLSNVSGKYAALKEYKPDKNWEEEYRLMVQKYTDMKHEKDSVAKARDQKENYIKMLLDEKQLLYEEITELKKESRKLRDKLMSKSMGSGSKNSSDKKDLLSQSYDMRLDTSDLNIDKSNDMNKEDRVKHEIEELQQLQIDELDDEIEEVLNEHVFMHQLQSDYSGNKQAVKHEGSSDKKSSAKTSEKKSSTKTSKTEKSKADELLATRGNLSDMTAFIANSTANESKPIQNASLKKLEDLCTTEGVYNMPFDPPVLQKSEERYDKFPSQQRQPCNFLTSNCDQNKVASPSTIRNSKDSDFELNFILHDMKNSNDNDYSLFQNNLKSVIDKENNDMNLSKSQMTNNSDKDEEKKKLKYLDNYNNRFDVKM